VTDFLLQHVNVNVDDLNLAVAFYRDVLGLPLDDTPDQGFRSQFFRIGKSQQIHMNEIADSHQFRGHFCLVVPDFVAVFRAAKRANAIDTKPWGRVRRLPSGAMQMFVRDPAGNLVEVGSAPDAVIDAALFADPLVEPKAGFYRMAPGASEGAHETR
jgi:catechol 2,3-dioxygenase-like lactoylglutathione lyase family enzyme